MSDISEFALEPAPFDSSTRLLDELGALFEAPARALSTRAVETTVRKSVRRFGRDSSPKELEALRKVLNELVFQINQLESQAGIGQKLLDRQDNVVQAALHAARRGAHELSPAPMTTAESVAAGDAAMAAAQTNSLAGMRARIASGELIGSAALQGALDIKRQALSNAVKAGRLFALTGPSGENYYPAFYADPGLDRRSVESVAKALGTLPGAAKLFFFTSKSTLLQETPLAALRKGRLAEVLTAATGFAAR